MHPPTALLLATGPESNARKITEYDDVQAPRSIPNFVLLLDGGIMRVSIISICWYDFLFPLFSSSLCITSYKLILGGAFTANAIVCCICDKEPWILSVTLKQHYVGRLLKRSCLNFRLTDTHAETSWFFFSKCHCVFRMFARTGGGRHR